MVSIFSISKIITVHPVSCDIFLTMTLEASLLSVMFGTLNRKSYLYSLLISILFQLSLDILSDVQQHCIYARKHLQVHEWLHLERNSRFFPQSCSPWPLHCSWYYWPFTPWNPPLPWIAWAYKTPALPLPLQSFLLCVLHRLLLHPPTLLHWQLQGPSLPSCYCFYTSPSLDTFHLMHSLLQPEPLCELILWLLSSVLHPDSDSLLRLENSLLDIPHFTYSFFFTNFGKIKYFYQYLLALAVLGLIWLHKNFRTVFLFLWKISMGILIRIALNL